MKYTVEEYNNKLLLELEYSQQKGELTEDLKMLYFDLANDISKDKERYQFISEDERIMCVVFAYEKCVKFAIMFNRHKTDDAYHYVNTIIRGSIAGTLLNQYKRRKKLHHDNN